MTCYNELHWSIKNIDGFPDGYDRNCRKCLDEIIELKYIAKVKTESEKLLDALKSI